MKKPQQFLLSGFRMTWSGAKAGLVWFGAIVTTAAAEDRGSTGMTTSSGGEVRGGVVKGEEKSMSCETRGKRDRIERGGISAAAGQLTPPLSGCDPKEIAASSGLF